MIMEDIASLVERLDMCKTEGHMEKFVHLYNLDNNSAKCYCGRCESFYERPFTKEEHEHLAR